MSGPEKPFSCLKSGCGESFTNEDRLAVHAKKHDMELELGPKGEAFVADQTPTPTRFIRNCEEVGLFQDLQNVNPFEETFKRAIESRTGTGTHTLNLENNLVIANADDTLHTPHIFPNISEDNGSGVYATSTDPDRSLLSIQRSSSDETNNHLSVVRCLSSSVDDTHSHRGTCDNKKTNEEIKYVKRNFCASKVKILRRQESIDLPDEITDVPMLSNLVPIDRLKSNVEQDHINIVTVPDSMGNSVPPRISQIPIISISEIPKCDEVPENNHTKEVNSLVLSPQSLTLPRERELDNARTEQKTYLNVNSCIKNNNAKLISQKSIEMALANFTNEAQTKLVDLNNISIEDIPENSSIMRENSKDTGDAQPNCMSDNRQRQLIFVQNTASDVNLSNKDESINTKSYIPSQNNTTDSVPVIEINDSMSSVSTQKGYELILKWPDGKQIYLKEMNENDTPNSSQMKSSNEEPQNDNANRNVTSNVKRKLKDMIRINAKRIHMGSNNMNTDNNPVGVNTFPVQNVAPDKYIIVPQVAQELKVPVIPNNYNIVPVISQTHSKKECTLFHKDFNLSNVAQPVIRAVLNGKICEATSVIQPVKNITASKNGNNLSLVNNTKIVRRYVTHSDRKNFKKTDQVSNTINIEEDQREMKKKGNRAAVLRYRLRGKQKQRLLIERNEVLEQKNFELTELLRLAYAEIDNLRKKIGNSQTHLESDVGINSRNQIIHLQESFHAASENVSIQKQSVIFKTERDS